jgi:hypothetical protein
MAACALALRTPARDVGQDPVHPGLQARPPVKSSDALDHGDPCVLDHIVGDGIDHVQAGHPPQAATVEPDELAKRGLVASH